MLPVERLADAAGMSPSSFHQRFRAVTSTLIEARRLMLAEGLSARSAPFELGYDAFMVSELIGASSV